MVDEFKLAMVYFAHSNPMQLFACTWINCWTEKAVENQDWTSRPPGHRRPRAVGRQAVVGHWAVAVRGPACF